MNATAIPVESWQLPGGCGEVLAVYVDGVELSRADWQSDGERIHLSEPIAIRPSRRGEVLAEALVWVGHYPPRTAVTAVVWRSGGSYVVDAWPARTE